MPRSREQHAAEERARYALHSTEINARRRLLYARRSLNKALEERARMLPALEELRRFQLKEVLEERARMLPALRELRQWAIQKKKLP